MEFSKIIAVWAMVYTSLTTVFWAVVYLVRGNVSGELIGLTGAVITGVIVSYSAKAGAENYIKIRERKREEA
jgi:hypothetical protein